MALSFTYQDSCLVPTKDLQELLEKLQPEVTRIAAMRTNGYDDPVGFIHAPFDDELHEKVIALAQKKQQLSPKLVLLVGIGGSNLGALAVHEALHGRLYNDLDPEIAFYAVDTLDGDKIKDLYAIVEQKLKQGHAIVMVVATKSGTTTETTVNAALFLELLKRYCPDNFQDYCVMVTDSGSPLETYGHEIGCDLLEIPEQIGGRYSVLTAVGLFPLALLGVDIKLLCKGAADMVKQCTAVGSENYAVISAAILFYYYSQGIHIHDSFFFDDAYESLGKWYRQLMAESLGKEHDIAGNTVKAGMVPTVSMGTVDLHSMAQLYLGGPRLYVTTFIAAEQLDAPVIPKSPLTHAGGRVVSMVQDAIFDGVRAAYQKEKRPFTTVLDVDREPESLGAFLQFKMLEIVYLGFLMHVNPFDQPHVELYKKEVRELLQ